MKDGSNNKANESTTLKKIRKKKLSPIEELMDDITAPLRSWLLSELIANKELAFKFKTHFSNEGLQAGLLNNLIRMVQILLRQF